MPSLLQEIQSLVPARRGEIESLWLALWAQPDGLALTKIMVNFRMAIDEQIQRVADLAKPSLDSLESCKELRSWLLAIDDIQRITISLPSELQEGMSRVPKGSKSHPIARRGLTAHGIYSAFWNCHESTGNQLRTLSAEAESDGRALRRLQLLCVQVQSSLVEVFDVNISDYIDWFHLDDNTAEQSDKKPYDLRDYFYETDKFKPHQVGLALRELSWCRHQPLLELIQSVFKDEESKTIRALTELDLMASKWKSSDAEIQKERESIVNALRLFFEEILDSGVGLTSRHRRKGGTRIAGKHKIESGYIGTQTNLVAIDAPEDLPELDGWVPNEEVWSLDDDELSDGDDTEAPKKTGLTLIHPSEIAGNLAKLKAQQHHCAMLRQGFGWDIAALADSEKHRLNGLLSDLKQTVDTEDPLVWLPKAEVAVSWLLGRTLEEAVFLRLVSPARLDLSDAGLAVSQTDEGVVWRLPLRFPKPSKEEFTHRLDRIDHIRVPDVSGLGSAIVRMHQRRGVKGESVFAWTRPTQKRLQLAKDEIKQLDEIDGGLKRIIPVRVARGLRIELLNLVPDRTIAWMIAGTRQEASESRMYYASQTPEELVEWMVAAQIKMLSLISVDLPARQAQTMTAAAHREPSKSYAGARFLPGIERLQRLNKIIRHIAQQFPPVKVRGPNYVVDVLDAEARLKRPSRTIGLSMFWDTTRCWRAWHDDVVLWVWLVQSLQTGVRAIAHPSSLYYQWLCSPGHPWVSPEDKISRDHDESRACLMTPLLREAFSTLMATQEAYAHRWKAGSSKKRSQKPGREPRDPIDGMPMGFVVFDGKDTPHALQPAWALKQIKRTVGVNWPRNFSRSLLRRALAERGLSGDDLDAFLGHGALSDRVHDGHSLFEPQAYFDRLMPALIDFGASVNLQALNHRVHLDPDSTRYREQSKLVIFRLKKELGLSGSVTNAKAGRKKIKEGTLFDRWCHAVAKLTKEKSTTLAKLKNWYAVLENSNEPFAKFLLLSENADGQKLDPSAGSQDNVDSGSSAQIEPGLKSDQLQPNQTPKLAFQNLTQVNADAFERELIDAFAATGSMLNRSETAFGFNMAYRICRELYPGMPTMKLALTAAAKVSPYTIDRMRSASNADDWLVSCRKKIRNKEASISEGHSTTEPGIELALSSFLNVTTTRPRWMALARTLTEEGRSVQKPFALPFEYQLKGLGSKNRQHRGFVDSISLNLMPIGFSLKGKVAPDFKNMKPKISDGPRDLGAWVTGLRWWSRLRLPPLVAEHFAGVLDDQCASGPWGEQFSAATSSKFDVGQGAQADFEEQAIVPPLVVRDADVDPFGWSPDLPHANATAGKWLRGCLLALLGADQNAGPEDLSEALDEAMYFAPSSYRRELTAMRAKICKNYGLDNEIDSEYGGLHVDRQVIGFETYHRLLDQCSEACIKERFSQRQRHLRLLLVIGFRFGMRRREILGLRRIDVDLIGTGRIHVRTYLGHTLKTNFSRRCLPVTPLLPQMEREWLAQAIEGLDPNDRIFPDHEHDTLSRDAIERLRSVAGDSSLKLHHLRHSFASFLALKLVLARHPDWIGAFAPWLRTTAELSLSQDLVGSLIKPCNAAGDFFVVPRLLGHSSHQVSLTHYSHTLDIAAALYQCHVLSAQTLPDREIGPLIHKRFHAAQQIRGNAMVWPAESLAKIRMQKAPIASLPRSRCLDRTLFGWIERCQAGEPPAEVLPTGLDLEGLRNWFSPRQAVILRDRLITASDALSDEDVQLLSRLGAAYWQPNPPMFWFSELRKKNYASAESTMVDDAVALINLFRKAGFEPTELMTWRYAKAAEPIHQDFWRKAIDAAGLPGECQRRSGRSDATKCLGLSLGVAKIKRTELLAVWWLGLCHAQTVLLGTDV
jgi:integrase